jgi:DNA-directed RNA polymerase specialized sigma subunit
MVPMEIVAGQDGATKYPAYHAWAAEPTSENLRVAVESMQPTLHHVLRSIGGQGDPYLFSRGRVLMAHAIRSYDPTHGADLKTWISRQLLPLRRERRLSQSPVRMPESVQLDALNLSRAEAEFIDKHGRDPDMNELSDATNMPIRRIEKVRRTHKSVPSDLQVSGTGEADSAGITPSVFETDFADEALDYVYQESDLTDRKILEHKAGYGGADVLSGKDLATKLGISDAQISRRSAKLGMKIQDYDDILRRQHG